MGKYTTSAIDPKNYSKLIKTVRSGYIDSYGRDHKPNDQVATVLVLEANLGCRIGDIMALRTDSIIREGGIWKLNITEQKTKKKRSFIVPPEIKAFIDDYAKRNGIIEGKLFSIKAPAVWKCLRQVTEYLGLENISTHSFRKAAGQAIYENSGYDLALVSEFYQHSSPASTLLYLKRSSKKMEEAISKMVTIA